MGAVVLSGYWSLAATTTRPVLVLFPRSVPSRGFRPQPRTTHLARSLRPARMVGMSSPALTPHPDRDVLGSLDPEQRSAAEAVRGPVCILAGAGTGKTRTITHRIAHAVLSAAVEAEEVLAVTFTARAAGELRTRLRALGVGGVQARTFHAAALRQLTYFWPQVIGGEPPRLVESKLRLVADAVNRSLRVSLPIAELRDVTSEIEWAKSSLVSPTTYESDAARARRQPPRPPETIAAIFEAYEEVKTGSGQLDFEDLLLLTSAMI